MQALPRYIIWYYHNKKRMQSTYFEDLTDKLLGSQVTCGVVCEVDNVCTKSCPNHAKLKQIMRWLGKTQENCFSMFSITKHLEEKCIIVSLWITKIIHNENRIIFGFTSFKAVRYISEDTQKSRPKLYLDFLILKYLS